MPENRNDRVRDGRDLMQNDGMNPPLMFHPRALSLVWPMPQRIDVLFGSGVIKAPEHPNYRYPQPEERTGEATI